ncbi:MAG TPA: hypothetical protein VG496_01735, partial [Myxococcales bacterium]|nr:hypothetical protein [Myxococcales bacterium]
PPGREWGRMPKFERTDGAAGWKVLIYKAHLAMVRPVGPKQFEVVFDNGPVQSATGSNLRSVQASVEKRVLQLTKAEEDKPV